MAEFFVIGGAGGVGSAVVNQLVSRGDQVCVTVLNAKERNMVESRYGDQLPIHELDLADPQTFKDKFQQIVEAHGNVDGIAVCAAISPFGPTETTPLSVFENAYRINTLSHVAIYQAAMPTLRKTRGRIVFTSSMVGRVAMPFIGPYVATKYALEGVGDVMRREAEPQGVYISLVEPGGIKTPMVEAQIREAAERIANLSDEEDSLYGPYYRNYHTLAIADQQQGASPPEEVASVIVKALTAEVPDTRYVVGPGAEQLIGLAATLPDRELDNAFVEMFTPKEG